MLSFKARQATGRERVLAVILLPAIIAIGATVGYRDPQRLPFAPRCPSRAVLGLECPGCGSTRAVHYLVNLDPGMAWRHNPALLLIGVPLLLFFMAGLIATITAGRHWSLVAPRRTGLLIAGMFIVYAVVRNLPYPAFDALRPPVISETHPAPAEGSPPTLADQ